MILRFDLWKHSDVYGLDNYWANRWYLDTPRAIPDTWYDMQYLIPIEATFHHTHVRYSHVTVVNPSDLTDAHIWAANNWDPYNPDYRGAVGQVTVPAPYNYVKKVSKWPTMGRRGHWWFRGGLDMAEIDPARGVSHASNNDMQPWRNRLSTWIDQLAAQGSTLQIGLGANRAGQPVAFQPATRLIYDGIAIMKASTRSQAKVTGIGPNLYQTINPKLREFRDWVFNVGTWWNTGSNAVPQSVKQGSVTEIGDLKAILNDLKSFADDVNGGEGDSQRPAQFRWNPQPDTVSTFAESTVSTMADDLDTINNIVPYSPDGVNYYITHANTDTILNILIKYMAVYSQISLIDFRNPANNQTQS